MDDGSKEQPKITAGLDIGDNYSYLCLIDTPRGHKATEDPHCFEKSRSVGAYLGLVPARVQTADRDPQRRISKEGDEMMRRLLVGNAHYVSGSFGSDSALGRHGQKTCLSGSQEHKRNGRLLAVARKLSVLVQ